MICTDSTQILSELKINKGFFPFEAVSAAIAQKDEITPELLSVLETDAQHPQHIENNPSYMLHIYAMFLLAQFRENKSYPLIVKLFSHPDVDADLLAGDFVTENLCRVLATICDGDTSRIEQIIENKEIDQWVRVAGIHALVVLVVWGLKSRDSVLAYYKSLFAGKLEREPIYVWGSLVSCCCDLGADEVYEDIKQVFDDQLIDPFFMDLDYVTHSLGIPWVERRRRLQADRHRSLIDDTIADMQWWACFQPKDKPSKVPKMNKRTAGEFQKRSFKIGRNEPCPCGSGTKYKKCCGSLVKVR